MYAWDNFHNFTDSDKSVVTNSCLTYIKQESLNFLQPVGYKSYTYPDPVRSIAFGKPTTSTIANDDTHNRAVNAEVKYTYKGWETFLNVNTNPSVTIDLEGVYDIDKLKLLTYYHNNIYHNYTVSTSLDGINWTENVIEKTNNNKATIDGDIYSKQNGDFSEIQARFIKITHNSMSSNYQVFLIEFEAYGTPLLTGTSNKALNAEEALPTNILVYPSPVSSNENFVNIDLSAYTIEGDVEIKVSNALGQTIYSKTINNLNDVINLDAKYLSEGLNFLHCLLYTSPSPRDRG